MKKKFFLYMIVALLGTTFTYAQGTGTPRDNVNDSKARMDADRAARNKAARQGKPHEAVREQKNLKEDKKDLKEDRKDRKNEVKDKKDPAK